MTSVRFAEGLNFTCILLRDKFTKGRAFLRVLIILQTFIDAIGREVARDHVLTAQRKTCHFAIATRADVSILIA